jgi:hypothetical protein
MPLSMALAAVSMDQIQIEKASGLRDMIETPHKYALFNLVRGSQSDVLAVLKTAHICAQWRSRSSVIYLSDKELQDMKRASYDREDGADESPYLSGQGELARTGLLVITVGVAQTRSAGEAVMEALSLRVEKMKPCWLVSMAEMPLEASPIYSPGVSALLSRFRPVNLGAPSVATIPSIMQSTKPKTMVAKYAGKCPVCDKTYLAGIEVAWVTDASGKGQRVHPKCAR